MAPVFFWSQPAQYLKWALREKPAIVWALIIGGTGPIMATTVPSIRRKFGDGPRPQIPLTYPIPDGPRKIPQGYDD